MVGVVAQKSFFLKPCLVGVNMANLHFEYFHLKTENQNKKMIQISSKRFPAKLSIIREKYLLLEKDLFWSDYLNEC